MLVEKGNFGHLSHAFGCCVLFFADANRIIEVSLTELDLRLSELERKILLPRQEAELVFDSHNKYSFQKVIHRSAMSIVVSASCHYSNKPVVVKLLKKEKDFQHECQILRTLGGRSYTIKLLDTISCSGFYAGGLVFTQYESASKFIPSTRDELNLFMVQLLKVSILANV